MKKFLVAVVFALVAVAQVEAAAPGQVCSKGYVPSTSWRPGTYGAAPMVYSCSGANFSNLHQSPITCASGYGVTSVVNGKSYNCQKLMQSARR